MKKSISLKYYRQMNPPEFILNVLNRIEKRNEIETIINRAGIPVTMYKVTDREYDTLTRFKEGRNDPKYYGPKHEEVTPTGKRGLNLPKKPMMPVYDSPPLSTLRDKSNLGIVTEFFNPEINLNIQNWGSKNLSIVRYPNGWALMNYKTYLAWRNNYGEFYINNQRYSSSTTTIQNMIKNLVGNIDKSLINFSDEDGVYQASRQENPHSYQSKGYHNTDLWEIVSKVIDKRFNG